MAHMLHDSPLRSLHEEVVRNAVQRRSLVAASHRPGAAVGHKASAQIEYLPYGATPAGDGPACELVASFGEVELEYAAIRRSAALLDCPNRGTLVISGDANERKSFLNRMLTQELKDLAPGTCKQSFWLNRKGRIDADVLLIELGDRMLVDVDILQAASAAKSLGEFIVMEDVKIEDASSRFHHLALHGPGAAQLLAPYGVQSTPMSDPPIAMECTIANRNVVVARRDQTGEIGFELIVPYDGAAAVWRSLLEQAAGDDRSPQVAVQPIGWHAFNIARIEAGTPLFNIDFGPSNLPHESGILNQRVSFTKGCYLGQEVVARMQNLGKPKQLLVGLRMNEDRLPSEGEQVFAMNENGSMADEVGSVTSSTLSPMLSAASIAFAMIRTSHAANGVNLIVNAEGEQARATVAPLQFWAKQAESVRS